MVIRSATPADARALAAVLVGAWQRAYSGIVPRSHLERFTVDKREDVFRRSLTAGAEETYVAETDGSINGLLTLGPCRDDDVDTSVTGEIWGIYVPPARWRQGIGRALASFAERELTSRGYGEAVLWVLEANAAARRFYEAMGCVADPSSVKTREYLGTTVETVTYQLKLRP